MKNILKILVSVTFLGGIISCNDSNQIQSYDKEIVTAMQDSLFELHYVYVPKKYQNGGLNVSKIYVADSLNIRTSNLYSFVSFNIVDLFRFLLASILFCLVGYAVGKSESKN